MFKRNIKVISKIKAEGIQNQRLMTYADDIDIDSLFFSIAFFPII